MTNGHLVSLDGQQTEYLMTKLQVSKFRFIKL